MTNQELFELAKELLVEHDLTSEDCTITTIEVADEVAVSTGLSYGEAERLYGFLEDLISEELVAA